MIVILVLITIAAVALGLFFLTRPSSVRASATPADVVTIVGSSVAAADPLEA
ncbi:MAG: hypothetical protein RBS17_09095 [Coriobacteriia bacterium]|nr:hypothetical protein [Coriobacteriia bacterium]